MRYLMATFVFLAVGLLALPAWADDDKKKADPADDGPRAELREKMIKEFDKDGDGKLSDEERQTARERTRELRGDRGRGGPGAPGGPNARRGDAAPRPDAARPDARRPGGPRPDARRPDAPRPEARRGPQGRGPEAELRGRGQLPKLEDLFAKFDKDDDDKLSKDEFQALAKHIREQLPLPPRAGQLGPPPGGRRFEGRIQGWIIEGPAGPPTAFRGEGPGPGLRLRGPDGPPPDDARRGEFRRGPRDGGPPPADGEGPRGRRGDRGERRGPPPANDDDRDDNRDDNRPPRDRDRDHPEKAEKDNVDSAI